MGLNSVRASARDKTDVTVRPDERWNDRVEIALPDHHSLRRIGSSKGLSRPEARRDGALITDIGPLHELILLRLVVLDNNPGLTDLQPLVDNRGFGTRSELWARETGLSCADFLPLTDRGVTVLSDC